MQHRPAALDARERVPLLVHKQVQIPYMHSHFGKNVSQIGNRVSRFGKHSHCGKANFPGSGGRSRSRVWARPDGYRASQSIHPATSQPESGITWIAECQSIRFEFGYSANRRGLLICCCDDRQSRTGAASFSDPHYGVATHVQLAQNSRTPSLRAADRWHGELRSPLHFFGVAYLLPTRIR
jgi:hypothetical protein